ncbi:hypothetical protein NHX12_033209 [Muraenolepis orangiensis]|uniref:Protein crumbs homolog 1 n=1 Tax=Muraenolepis orangiensis TaxID=630683 RepID=A0A9Q0IJF7_9TELE|nr:hypothetical protein NHX12_033209 [Muraenolepis orangiensis]
MDMMRGYYFELLLRVIFASALFVTDATPPGRLPTTADPCSSNPCQNRALCRSRGNGYSCFCVPGFQGARCQIDVNECVSQPCLNGATCMDRVGRYTCLCPPGFTGSTCQLQIDECQSQPCLNGGSCHDAIRSFACTCMTGFHGDRCENNTSRCQNGPCQNGALCVDGPNEYSCVCTGPAFTGQHCETLVPPCQSEPCFNSALCQDNGSNYTCKCWPGFSGRQCERDIGECDSGPCAHGARCVERSWQPLYGSEPLLPTHYDPRQAQGYLCSCPPGTSTLCQELVDRCESSPCQNGGSCENQVGGYACHCLTQSQGGLLYGGADCHVTLAGCDDHRCQNGAGCRPLLAQDDRIHNYSCSCVPGFTGPLCQAATTFSFQRSGYLLLRRPRPDGEASCNVTLSFRTALPRAVLFQRGSISGGLLLSLELRGGQPRLTLRKEPSTLEVRRHVADGEWHTVEVLLGKWTLGLALLDDAGSCQVGEQHCRVTAAIRSTLAGLASHPLENTFVGGVPGEEPGGAADKDPPPAFVGCMRDLLVDGQLVVPEGRSMDSAVNVSPGCSHRDRCVDTPCLNGGQCINLWQSHRCRCPRPYEGADCGEEYLTARFGSQDSPSYAVFSITDHLGQDLAISFFLRTRQQTGLLLAIAEGRGVDGGDTEDSAGSGPYLRMWLEGGKVKVQVNGSERLESGSALSDGEVHFVSVEVVGGRGRGVTLSVGDRRQGYAPLGRPLDTRAGDTVYVGGLREEGAASASGEPFKGCLQDLRINDRRLQFFRLGSPVRSYPLEAVANVSAGCSGDDACRGNPCLNGGRCLSTWDHFNCTCPSHTAGRRCEEASWCEMSLCPAGSECRALGQGYECYSNVTLWSDGAALSYRGNGRISRDITSLTLSLRTHTHQAAALLHAERGSAFVTLSLQDGLLCVVTVSLRSRRAVNDGEWHTVHLFMVAPWARRSRWTLVMDEDVEEASTSAAPGAGSLNFLRREADIFLGGPGGPVGCVGPVELGGVVLPYFSSSRVNPPQDERFVLTSAAAPRVGCSGGALCEPDPCLNGGLCSDLFDRHRCSCPPSWVGRRCEAPADPCASGPCGADCEAELDVCELHLCAHGATCLHGPDLRYACLCAENYTGPLCNERVEAVPWYIVVRNIRPPRLPVSVCGDDTRNYTCFNGGNCSDRQLSCHCPPGFTGHRFAGDQCQTDLTSDGLTSALLLPVSLLSVLLLLVFIVTTAGLVVALNRRATRGAYSPSRQEKEGSRVEMWNITQPPPTERLI